MRQNVLKLYQRFLIAIPRFTDYGFLQQFEIDVFHTMEGFQNIIEVEIIDRNKYVNAIEKRLLRRNNFQHIEELRPEENQNAIEELKTEKRQLENKNKEILNFQKELQEKIDLFQQQVAIKKQHFKSLLPSRT